MSHLRTATQGNDECGASAGVPDKEAKGFVRYIRVPRTASGTYCLLHDISADHRPAYVTEGPFYGFIRNPWDWFVSMYNAGMNIGVFGKEPFPGGKILPEDAPGIHPGQRMNFTFPEWCRLRVSTPMDWLTRGREVGEIHRMEDFVAPLRVERKNAVDHLPYREWYDDETREVVARKCWREIEIGGYEF